MGSTTDFSLSTVPWYAEHAEEYFQRTAHLNMSQVHEPFLSRLKARSNILDLGCGSGRDARCFASLGHTVVALDPCHELLTLAAKHTPRYQVGRIIYVLGGAPDLAFADEQFDAVWACASLLHLPRKEMASALDDCRRILRPGGLIALGMKEGVGDVDDNGRFTALWESCELAAAARVAGLNALLATRVLSLDGRGQSWLNVVAARR